jgi:uncharacterized protein YlzI (FlbEa/FlbD family)
MKKFPKFNSYTDDQLIMIIYDNEDRWQKEAVLYAKKLLIDRGISLEYSKQRIIEIRKEVAILWARELNERKIESYSIISIALMTLFWPRYIFSDWYLKKNGYDRMRYQRLVAIGSGLLLYFVMFINSDKAAEESKIKRIAEIDKQAKQDNIALSKIDWSGEYSFIDSSSQHNNQLIWAFQLSKTVNEHKGTLSMIGTHGESLISCYGLIKKDIIEFFPDTIYTLHNGTEITYNDKLFSFGRDNGKIVTQWSKLKPFYSEKSGLGEFFITKNNL